MPAHPVKLLVAYAGVRFAAVRGAIAILQEPVGEAATVVVELTLTRYAMWLNRCDWPKI